MVTQISQMSAPQIAQMLQTLKRMKKSQGKGLVSAQPNMSENTRVKRKGGLTRQGSRPKSGLLGQDMDMEGGNFWDVLDKIGDTIVKGVSVAQDIMPQTRGISMGMKSIGNIVKSLKGSGNPDDKAKMMSEYLVGKGWTPPKRQQKGGNFWKVFLPITKLLVPGAWAATKKLGITGQDGLIKGTGKCCGRGFVSKGQGKCCGRGFVSKGQGFVSAGQGQGFVSAGQGQGFVSGGEGLNMKDIKKGAKKAFDVTKKYGMPVGKEVWKMAKPIVGQEGQKMIKKHAPQVIGKVGADLGTAILKGITGTGYCMRCKSHTHDSDAHQTRSKNGRGMLKSKCQQCGCGKSRFISGVQ